MTILLSTNKKLYLQLKCYCLLLCFSIFVIQSVHAAATDDFVITVDTTKPGSPVNRFVIPTIGSGYNYNVDCDDDGVNDFIAQNGSVVCDYGLLAGIHTIRIKDNTGLGTGFPRIYFNNQGDKEKILSIHQWGTGKWTSMAKAFYGCSNLNSSIGPLPVIPPNLSKVKDMSWMFALATTFDIPIDNWVTSKVTNMSAMFREASAFNGAIGSWNTSKVTNMSEMFYIATAFNQNIGGWDTSKVTNMARMFSLAFAFNQPIGSWDTSQVTDMSLMFWAATAFNGAIGNWNTSEVTDMRSMFADATVFSQPIGNWDTSKVTDMGGMFFSNSGFNQPIGNWDTSQVTIMSQMFEGATGFNQPIGNWDTSQVTNMSQMFKSAIGFDQPIGNWNVTEVNNMTSMFNGVTLSKINYDLLLIGWNAQVLKSGVMFDGGNSTYCLGEDAWNNMDINDSWTITDGGLNCPVGCNINLASGTQTGAAMLESCDQLYVDATFHAEPTATVVLSAGTGITFYPGFTVDQGGILQAKVCGQSLCESSNQPMEYGCHSCVTQICDANPSCCDTAFDVVCQLAVSNSCSLTCE